MFSSENDCKGECWQTALGAGPASVVKEDVWQYSDDWRNLNEYLCIRTWRYREKEVKMYIDVESQK